MTQWQAGFKNSAKPGTIRPIRNRLGANRVDNYTKYETKSGLVKIQWTRPSSRDDSINSMKIQRIEYKEPKKNLKKISNFQRFL